jgi:nucleotide-binding universal stress UspA family protein
MNALTVRRARRLSSGIHRFAWLAASSEVGPEPGAEAFGDRAAAHAGPVHERRVMVCLDRSKVAEAALPFAGFVTQALGAELRLIHVMPSGDEGTPHAVDLLDWEISRREAEQYLEDTRRRMSAFGVATASVHTGVDQGRPAARLLALERDFSSDMIVLCRHGEGGFASPLGATAQRVLSQARASVLLVPARADAGARPVRRMVVALDGSSRAESVLSLATRLARRDDVEVTLVHVVAEPSRSAVFADADTLELASELATRTERAAAGYLARICARLSPVIPRLTTRIVRARDVREALLGVAMECQADLLLLSAHGATCNTHYPYGAVATHMLHHAEVPVLVAQDLVPPSLAPTADVTGAQVAH